MTPVIARDEAWERIAAHAAPLETVAMPLRDAVGRVVASDVTASIDIPGFDRSAMDGYAVRSADTPGELELVGEVAAGAAAGDALQPGTARRIFTGGAIPDGADAVERQEDVEVLSDGRVRLPAVEPGQHIRRRGEDVPAGSLLLRAGERVTAQALTMLAGSGLAEVPVRRPARVGLLLTGDELVPVGQPLGPGQIYETSGIALRTLIERAGAEAIDLGTVGDDRATTIAGVKRGLDSADVLLVNGGVSVGEHDHVKRAMADLGAQERFWRVGLKPGKPTWFGTRGRTLVFGLPGNPVSAMVTFTLFARPALRALQGADPGATRSTAVLDGPIEANADRDQAVRCRLRMDDDGWHAEPTGPQGSHVMSSMLGAAALAIVPAGERDLAPGERVTIELI
jgi:molybdopterin molybdotransferase